MNSHHEKRDQLATSETNGHQAQAVDTFAEFKRSKILEACEIRDIVALADLATTEGGLLQYELRKVACETSHLRTTLCACLN